MTHDRPLTAWCSRCHRLSPFDMERAVIDRDADVELPAVPAVVIRVPLWCGHNARVVTSTRRFVAHVG